MANDEIRKKSEIRKEKVEGDTNFTTKAGSPGQDEEGNGLAGQFDSQPPHSFVDAHVLGRTDGRKLTGLLELRILLGSWSLWRT
jgi:hypothetical protein